MSHARIFELCQDTVEQRLGASDLYDSAFLSPSGIADYVYDEGVSREAEIANFVATLNEVFVCFNKTDGTIVFSPGFRRDYFAERFELFKVLAQRLTLEDFIEEENQGMTLYLLTQTIESGFNTHIYENGHGVKSLDRFVRDLVEGEKYYFGGVVGFRY